ncbi:MAG: AAA family ATPase, partial [Thermodesulfobacteriota bacterium]
MMDAYLPVGIQDFERMITGGFLYVDKTRFIHYMVKPPQGFYFLARPRRFGKSLTVSTLDYLFQGRKALFKNLYIAGTEWEWRPHPVIKFDFNQMNSETSERLRESLLNFIFELSEDHGIRQTIRSVPDSFARLITQLFSKTGKTVVVLGYDAMLGYTAEELNTRFAGHVEALRKRHGMTEKAILEKIHLWYNGYRFTETETRVFNPFSVVRLFDAGKFDAYWFETGTPSFLVHLIKEKAYPVADIEDLILPKELFSVYDLDHLQLEPLLFQTGYITIDRFEGDLYRMTYPNREVKTAFLAYLLNDFAGPESARTAAVYKRLHRHLDAMKLDDFIEGVRSVLASIPYPQLTGKKDEAFFHTVFYLMLSASGMEVRSEVLTSLGRMDLAVEFTDKVFVIELKCGQNSEKAIQQIPDKRYYEKYLQTGRDVYLMGINFDAETRTIRDWQCSNLADLIS